jgi:hypothetical protein
VVLYQQVVMSASPCKGQEGCAPSSDAGEKIVPGTGPYPLCYWLSRKECLWWEIKLAAKLYHKEQNPS